MSTTFHLRVWTRFLAPLDDVWALKTDPLALAAEFRPQLSFSLAEEGVARARAGQLPTEIDARLRLGPIPPGVRWPIRLLAIEDKKLIRTSSENSLYSRFEHEMQFEPTPDGCRFIDAVTFVSRVPAQKAFAILTQRVFQHRHKVASARLSTDPQATAVGVLRVMVEDAEEVKKAG